MSETPKIEAQIELSGWQEVELAYERLASKGEESFKRVDEAAKDNTTTVRESSRAVQTYSQSVTVAVRQQAEAVDGFFSRLQSGAASVAAGIRDIALAATVATVGLSAAFTGGYVALGNFADSTARETVAWAQMADASGVAVDALSRYEYMAGVAAGSSDLVAGSFKNVNDLLIRYRENAADEAAVKPFRQLGLEAELVGGKFKNAEDVFARVEDQLRKIPDGALRSKAAFDLFGAGAKELFPVFNKTKAELSDLKDEAKRLGETKRDDLDLAKTTKLLEDKNRLKLAIDDLKDAVGSAFFPVLAKGAGNTAKFLNDNKEKITEFIEDAADKFDKFKDDLGNLFTAPKQERRLNVEVDGRTTDLTKARLKELVAAGRAAQVAVADAASGKPAAGGGDDDEEEGGDGLNGERKRSDAARSLRGAERAQAIADRKASAEAVNDVSLKELQQYVLFSGKRILADREARQSYVELDGKRVDITKANSALILNALSKDADEALARQNASSASSVKLNFGFMKSLYAPAQELRAIALDTWDAIRGEGFGDRSKTVALVGKAWDTATGYVVRFRDAVLGVFGLTAKDLPTMQQALDKVLATFTSFRMGLFGDKGKAEIPWAASAGKGVAYLGSVLESVWDVAKRVFGFMAPYAVSALGVIGDAFKALASYIQGNPIAADNTFNFVQKYIPDIEAGFAKIKAVATDAVEFLKRKFNDWFGEVTWGDLQNAAKFTFDVICGAAVIAFNTIVATFQKLKAIFDVLIVPIDIIAKLLGFDGWQSAALAYFVAQLILATAPGQALLGIFSSIFFAILPGLILGLLGIVGLVSLLIGIFGAVPIAIAAAVAAAIAACLAGFALLARVAYVFGDDIKAAFGKAADWVIDKWTKLKGLVVGAAKAVRKALGLGGGEEEAKPSEPAAATSTGAAIEKVQTKERAPTEYVLGTDGQYRSAEEGEERTRPEWMRRAAAPDAKPESIEVKNYRTFDGVTGKDVDPAVSAVTGAATLNDLLARIGTMQGGLSQQTPFTAAPPVLPEGKGSGVKGLVQMPIEIDPSDTNLYATEAGSKAFLDKLQKAGVAVRTGRPRNQ